MSERMELIPGKDLTASQVKSVDALRRYINPTTINDLIDGKRTLVYPAEGDFRDNYHIVLRDELKTRQVPLGFSIRSTITPYTFTWEPWDNGEES